MSSQRPDPSTARATNNSRRPRGISARKLAATLWELQEISLSRAAVRPSQVEDVPRRKPAIADSDGPSTTHMQVLKVLGRPMPVDCPEDEEDTHEIEVDKEAPLVMNMPSHPNNRAVAASNTTAATSSDLLNVLNRVWSLEEQHKSSVSAVNSLQSDLDCARSQVKHLTVQQMSHNREMENMQKNFADERNNWHKQEQERSNQAMQNIKDELDDEKKSKRKLDLVHRKVNKELIEVKKTLTKALQDLDREQKGRELMEDVCDELAREVGEDKARVEELKLESMKVREEVEEERKMLQVAEVWREERVQMKLAEARLEIEQKNTALDKLRLELDAFLKNKRASGNEFVDSSKAADTEPQLSKLQEEANEEQTSANLVSLLKDAYEVHDEQQSSGRLSVDAQIKGAIRKLEMMNDNSDSTNTDEDVDAEDDEEDENEQNFIEVNKASFMRGSDKKPPEKANCSDEPSNRNVAGKLSLPPVENVKNQTSRQGVLNLNANQADAQRIMGETKDKAKIWNFDPDIPWSTETVAGPEKADKRVSNEDMKEARFYERKGSNSKGDQYPGQGDVTGKASFQSTEKGTLQASFESVEIIDVNMKQPCDPSSSAIADMEGLSKGVWRDLGGTAGFSLAPHQQSGSPTRKWDTEMPLPSGLEGLQENLRADKSSAVGASKTSKDKAAATKGKPGEAKTEPRQGRFRIGRA